MKRAILAALIMVMSTWGWAQQPATGTTPPAQNQPSTQTPPASQPGAGQAGAAQPAAKHPPQAKTDAEFAAYNAAKALANDPAALEKATDDFAAKFPDSELTVLLYRDDMHAYQAANNADKMLDIGRKILKLNPDDPEALIGVAEVLTERTRDTDLDKAQRMEEAIKMANHALETIETVDIPAGTPQEKVDAYKNFMRSGAFAVLGTQYFNSANYDQAANYFRKSIDVYPQEPDPVVTLRLALTLDKQEKYQDALKEANRAVELTQESTTVGTLARRERDRLVQLTGGSIPAPAQPTAQNPAPPKK